VKNFAGISLPWKRAGQAQLQENKKKKRLRVRERRNVLGVEWRLSFVCGFRYDTLMFCRYCGSENSEDAQFCEKCGRKIGRAGEEFSNQVTVISGAGMRVEEVRPMVGGGDLEHEVLAQRYELKALLGRGGMGEVWLAYDRELQINVAVKCIPDELANQPVFLKNLRQEAKIAMELTHPNIARLFNFETDLGKSFLVMEHVAGVGLDQIVARRSRLTVGEVVAIVEGLADAIDYAHARGVLHRDIKPANIVVQLENSDSPLPRIVGAKILDFGIACSTQQNTVQNTQQASTGTPAYMSPEHLRGEKLSAQSDIYSFAATVYECLSGRPPFHDGDLMWQVFNQEVPDIEGLPKEISARLRTALAKDPNRRPGSCRELIDLLQGKSPGQIPGGEIPFIRELAAHPKAVITFALTRDDNFLFTGSADKSARLWDIHTGRAVMTYKGHLGAVRGLCATGDQRRLITGSWDATCKLWDVEIGKCLKTYAGHTQAVSAVALASDGKFFVSAGEDGTVKQWEVNTAWCMRTFEGHLGPVNAVGISADGGRLFTAGSDRTLKIWQIDTGRCIKVLTGHTGSITALALSCDGKYVASGSADRTAKLWEIESGACVMTYLGHIDAVRSLWISGDDKYLITGAVDRTAKFWDLVTGICLKTYEDHKGCVTAVALSANNKYLVTASAADGNIHSWLTPETCWKTSGGAR
jgi:serine/threonine protein kinase